MQTQFVQRVNTSFTNSPDVIQQTMQNTQKFQHQRMYNSPTILYFVKKHKF